jgi:hypothetical protein
LVSASKSVALTRGIGGDVQVNADVVSVLDDSAISTATFGFGRAGDIILESRITELRAGGQIVSNSSKPGNAGSVRIVTDALSLRDKAAVLTSSTRSNAGNIVVSALGGIDITGESSIAASAAGPGSGGNIDLSARGPIRIVRSELSSSTKGAGGNVSVTTRAGPLVVESSTISAEAGDNGNISLRAPADQTMLIRGSEITAEAGDNGGKITIDPRLVVLDRSDINGLSGGDPVDVTIISDFFVKSSDSTIRSDAVTVPVEADVASALARLSGALAAAQARLEALCGVRFGGDVSSFLVTGRGGLPPEPMGRLLSIESAKRKSAAEHAAQGR